MKSPKPPAGPDELDLPWDPSPAPPPASPSKGKLVPLEEYLEFLEELPRRNSDLRDCRIYPQRFTLPEEEA